MNIEELRQYATELEKKNKEQASLLNWYKEQLAIFNKQRYASKSEKTPENQLSLFNEIEDTYDNFPQIEEEDTDNNTSSTTTTKSKSRKSRKNKYTNLKVEIHEHKLDDNHCDECGSEMKELAPTIIDVLMYIPSRYYIERHIIHNYICKQCTDENLEAKIVTAPGAPKRLIKGSEVSPSVVAGIIVYKYVGGVPLYRQEQELKRKKILISRATMSNWLMACGRLIKPIYELMIADIRKQKHIHMDETTLLVLENKHLTGRQKSYMWMMASGIHEKDKIVIYSYNIGREYSYAKEMLGESFNGCVHCDGYEAYHKLSNTKIFGCFAHVRRKFVEAMESSEANKGAKNLSGKKLKAYYEEHLGYGNIVSIIDILRKLFKYERKYAELKYDKETIEKRRQEDQKPLLDDFFTRLEKHRDEYAPKSKMGEAIKHALNQKEYLLNYLEDGEAELSNNRGERFIKPFVMGRKAWLFSNTESGAEMSSIYYSLIETAKENKLDIEKYLTYILEEIKNNEDIDYRRLLPYSESLPDSIRIND